MNRQGPRRRGRRGTAVAAAVVSPSPSPSASSLPFPRHGGIREHSDGEMPPQWRPQRVSRLRKPRSRRGRRRGRGGAGERGRGRRGSGSCFRCRRSFPPFSFSTAAARRPRVHQRQGRQHVPEGVQSAVGDGGKVAQARDGELRESLREEKRVKGERGERTKGDLFL